MDRTKVFVRLQSLHRGFYVHQQSQPWADTRDWPTGGEGGGCVISSNQPKYQRKNNMVVEWLLRAYM